MTDPSKNIAFTPPTLWTTEYLAVQIPALMPAAGSCLYDVSPVLPFTFKLGTVLYEDEVYENNLAPGLPADEYDRRISACTSVVDLPGLQHGQWLVDHQRAFPALMALRGKFYIHLLGRREELPESMNSSWEDDATIFAMAAADENSSWEICLHHRYLGLHSHGRVAYGERMRGV